MRTNAGNFAENLSAEEMSVENHIIVSGQKVTIGPMLKHMMLYSQDLQDRLLGLVDQTEEILDGKYPVPETDGIILLTLEMVEGDPWLSVAYVDSEYTALCSHYRGDSVETLKIDFEGHHEIASWFDLNRQKHGEEGQEEDLPFPNGFGEYTKVKMTETDVVPSDTSPWAAKGYVWICCDELEDEQLCETRKLAA